MGRTGLTLYINILILLGLSSGDIPSVHAGEHTQPQSDKNVEMIASCGIQSSMSTCRSIASQYNITPDIVYRHLFHGFSADVSISQIADLLDEKPLRKVFVPGYARLAGPSHEYRVPSSYLQSTRIRFRSGTKELDQPIHKYRVFYPHHEQSNDVSPGIPSNMKIIQADVVQSRNLVSSEYLRDIHVAIIDEGTHPNHPYLKESDIQVKTFGEKQSGFMMSKVQHGTMISGIVAGSDGLGIGPGLKVTVYEAALAETLNHISWKKIFQAWDQIIKSDVDVVNMSFGIRMPQEVFQKEVSQYLRQLVESGKILVAGVGNRGENIQLEGEGQVYPAASPHVIAVSALGYADITFSSSQSDEEGRNGTGAAPDPPVVHDGGLLWLRHKKSVTANNEDPILNGREWNIKAKLDVLKKDQFETRDILFPPKSNWGKSIDVVAPGYGVSLGNYRKLYEKGLESVLKPQIKISPLGTSGAAAHVTGGLAMYLARAEQEGGEVDRSPEHIRQLLDRTGLTPRSGGWKHDQDDQSEPLLNVLRLVTMPF